MAETDRHAFLDRPAARGLAALVLLLCAGLLAYIHRDDVFRTLTGPADREDAAMNPADPAAPCIEQRFAEIDGMIEEGVVGGGQAALFRQRAEAMCRATDGAGAGAPLRIPGE